MSPSPDIHELENSMGELYGIPQVGLVQIQRPDQASKNLTSHVYSSEIVYLSMVNTLTDQTVSVFTMHPLGRNCLCFTTHIFYFSLRKGGCIILTKSIPCVCFEIEIS